MTDKELRRLGRAELLEMLISQSEENEQLREQVVNLQRLLDERRIINERAGSIAEASLMLNKIFEAAESAAQDYINNIRTMSEKQDEISRRIEEDAQRKMQQMIADTECRCQLLQSTTEKECEELKTKARRDADEYWDSVNSKLDDYLRQHSDLRRMLARDLPNVKPIITD